ncbi:hypothetical protein [Herbaspirillum rhizosphaerae]|uniref:hypothetical protein n=1 Tax=Herbaspirillum rhizosphaerae TaxID=346179 RepID=UPI00067D95CF|nr:hypothetical protein [Herbaspirillum rhizosphaerae]
MKKMLALLLLQASLMVSMSSNAALLEGNVFQPIGENLVVQPPSGWRLAYMNGSPTGDYVVEFMPQNETHENWREGYMSVQRGAADVGAGTHLSTQIVQRVLQGAQRNCSGHFTAMKQKDSMTNGAYTSISGGFCDRLGSAAPFGEGSLIGVFEGTKNLFLVQFGWRPATENELKGNPLRITPQRLQQFLDVMNRATLCGGGQDQLTCPH